MSSVPKLNHFLRMFIRMLWHLDPRFLGELKLFMCPSDSNSKHILLDRSQPKKIRGGEKRK